MRMNELPAGLRPRERLLSQGAEQLSDEELLAILLRTGTAGLDVMSLARAVIERSGSLAKLMTASPDTLSGIKGLGPAKMCQLLAVLELGRRAFSNQLKTGSVLDSPQAVRQFLRMRFIGETSECFLALFLDVNHQMIACEELFKGTLTRTVVYPREIVRRAFEHNAAAVIFAHNHPGGEAKPSAMDKQLTKELKRIMESVEISMLDHLIVSGSDVWSFQGHGLC